MNYFHLLSPALIGTVLVTSWIPVQAAGVPVAANPVSQGQIISLAASSATEAYNRGVDKYQAGDLKGALADFDEAIRLQDDFVSAYVNRANIKDDLGDPSGALVDYATALKYEQSDPNIYYNRGLTYSRLKQYEKAINDYDRAIELNPEYAPPYTGRAIIKHDILGDKEGGLKDLKMAADLYKKQGNEAKAREIMAVYEKLSN
jgi:tetratricopeptide (TPR) repeat protein